MKKPTHMAAKANTLVAVGSAIGAAEAAAAEAADGAAAAGVELPGFCEKSASAEGEGPAAAAGTAARSLAFIADDRRQLCAVPLRREWRQYGSPYQDGPRARRRCGHRGVDRRRGAVTDNPGRSPPKVPASPSSTMRTGTRCTILVKFPVAFSGGSRLNCAPVAGATLATCPCSVSPGNASAVMLVSSPGRMCSS